MLSAMLNLLLLTVIVFVQFRVLAEIRLLAICRPSALHKPIPVQGDELMLKSWDPQRAVLCSFDRTLKRQISGATTEG